MNARPLALPATPEPDRAVAHPRLVRRVLGVALLELLVALLAVPLVADSRPGSTMRAASALTTEDRCLTALETVQAAGLVLPTGFEYRCPGDTQAFPGDRQHWGVVCYYQMFCPEGAYIAVNPERVGRSDARLRYVVAHEIGHAIDYVTSGSTTEESADDQAHAAGF